MNQETATRLRRHLIAQVGLPERRVVGELIREWRLSGVERLHLPDGDSVVFKFAHEPLVTEHLVLSSLAAQGLPVPTVRAAMVLDGMLGMVLDDLGASTQEPTDRDAAIAAVRLHAAVTPMRLEQFGERDLATLPSRALACLNQLQASGRYRDTSDLRDNLAALDRVAKTRVVGAERPPFGFCHGELHPTVLHITPTGWWLLDFAMSVIGPGLFDLAAWSGLRNPADPVRTRRLGERYVQAGGHPDALVDRGGLPAERWALGWHRLQAAHWLLNCGTNGIDEPDVDQRHITVLRRQLAGAVDLLDAQTSFRTGRPVARPLRR